MGILTATVVAALIVLCGYILILIFTQPKDKSKKVFPKFVVEPQDDLTAKELFRILLYFFGWKRLMLRQSQFDSLPDDLKRHIKAIEGGD